MLSTHAHVSSSLNVEPPYIPEPVNPRIAVVLNANAKQVNPRLARKLERLTQQHCDVFLTQSLEHADFVVKRIVDERYECLVTGGGDGTVMHTIETALRRREEKGYEFCPRFAVLKLGTGNAIASHLGSNDIHKDLDRIRTAAPRSLDLFSVNGQRTTFGGFGWDAQILEDYDTAKERLSRAPMMSHFLKTLPGYFAIAFGQTIPSLLWNKPVQRVKVRNLGHRAFQLNSEGVIINQFAPGELIFDGETQIGCFGTIPYFGYRMKILPYATSRPGFLHLRLMNIAPLSAAARMRSVWNGQLKHPGLTDLLINQAHLEFEDEIPMHLSGDLQGSVKQLNLSVTDPISCIHFTS